MNKKILLMTVCFIGMHAAYSYTDTTNPLTDQTQNSRDFCACSSCRYQQKDTNPRTALVVSVQDGDNDPVDVALTVPAQDGDNASVNTVAVVPAQDGANNPVNTVAVVSAQDGDNDPVNTVAVVPAQDLAAPAILAHTVNQKKDEKQQATADIHVNQDWNESCKLDYLLLSMTFFGKKYEDEMLKYVNHSVGKKD